VRTAICQICPYIQKHGKSAGASLFHPHSQIIATPIVPKRIHDEISNSQSMEEMMGIWPILCHPLTPEEKEKSRIIIENDTFSAFSPYAARFPFETWIIPKRHMASFGSISPQEIRGFASILGRCFKKVKKHLIRPALQLHDTFFTLRFRPCLVLPLALRDNPKAYNPCWI